jgi:hypothetical protein
MELRIKGHLYEIQEINDKMIAEQQGLSMAKMGYQTTLMNVAECTDADVVDEVANYIKEYIDEYEERPPNRKVRRSDRTKVTQAEHPANQYLNAA